MARLPDLPDLPDLPPAAQAAPAPRVAPFARGLALLGAFTAQERWLSTREIAARTDIPAPTVSRLLRSLVALGYLHRDAALRKYALAAAVLSLGYAAIAHSELRLVARRLMQEMGDSTQTHLALGTRDRLDIVVLEHCKGQGAMIPRDYQVGERLGICGSPLGWALLGALPDSERFYLLENLERRFPREWSRSRRRIGEAMSQVMGGGFCACPGEGRSDMVTVAAPLMLTDGAPLVLGCLGRGERMTRARVDRDIGPRLLAIALRLQQAYASGHPASAEAAT
ncbi:IclR family transcriptional regulator [Cupriavidus sp. 30B13]|uniref:IclR family transcriptional regulator n=1 Tax=Cupriavidus sp. 30B13 TaxID=3384241 RepID=UPI003B907866